MDHLAGRWARSDTGQAYHGTRPAVQACDSGRLLRPGGACGRPGAIPPGRAMSRGSSLRVACGALLGVLACTESRGSKPGEGHAGQGGAGPRFAPVAGSTASSDTCWTQSTEGGPARGPARRVPCSRCCMGSPLGGDAGTAAWAARWAGLTAELLASASRKALLELSTRSGLCCPKCTGSGPGRTQCTCSEEALQRDSCLR